MLASQSNDGEGGVMGLDVRRRRTLMFVPIAAALSLAGAACDSDEDGGTTGGTAGGGAAVDVTVQEFSVLPEQESAPAGDVTFTVTNTGPEDTHEFVVFETDLAADALPTAPDGSVDEEGVGVELVDEIEDIAVGDSPTLTVSLDAGSYVLICNIVEDEGDETIVHYQQGMRTEFTVE
jgi:uncharacterized cupredoxin-like copper-binding protein